MGSVKSVLVILVSMGVILFSSSLVYADDESDLILKLLIKKGVITQREANELRRKAAKEATPQPKDLEERVDSLEEKVPAWIKNTKFKGDFRLRNEYISNDPGQDNNRQRIRFRLGAKTKLSDVLNIGFGLATGSSDTPVSTNQTLEQEFQSKQIWLDYAYLTYNPYDWLHLIGGKFKSPFFHTDMLWDSDIRFDGLAGKVSRDLNPGHDIPTSVYLTGGYFPIDDANTSTGDDIYLLALQGGTESDFKDGYVKLKTGLALYYFQNLKGTTAGSLVEEKGTNTYIGTWSSSSSNTATLANDYEIISPTVKVYFKDIFGRLDVPWGIFGEYAHNFDPSDGDDAWRLGLWLGDSKVGKKKQWKLLTQFSRLERDAFFDSFPDGDFNGAGTNGKGWEVIFDYGLTDNVIFSIDYYNTKSVSGSEADQQIVQTDLIFKF